MQDFFVSLPGEVASHLQALFCIPCIGSDSDPTAVVWVPPGKALVCSSPQIKELVSADQLARLQVRIYKGAACVVLSLCGCCRAPLMTEPEVICWQLAHHDRVREAGHCA